MLLRLLCNFDAYGLPYTTTPPREDPALSLP